LLIVARLAWATFMQQSIRASRLLNWGTFSSKITNVPAGSCVVELRISASTKGSAAALAVDTPGPAASETLSTLGLAGSGRVHTHELNEPNRFWCCTEFTRPCCGIHVQRGLHFLRKEHPCLSAQRPTECFVKNMSLQVDAQPCSRPPRCLPVVGVTP